MTIHYVLQESNLSTHPDGYLAVVRPAGTADLEMVIDRVLEQGSTVGRTDVVGVLEGYYTAIETLLLEGRNVTTPIANYRLSITGLFGGCTDRLDPDKHRIVPRISPGRRLRRVIRRKARAARKATFTPTPCPLQYTDLNSGTIDQLLTPGGLGNLYGTHLRFDPADPAQGIVFLDGEGGKTRVQVVATNKPRQLVFQVPPLPAGTYRLEVRATVYDSADVRGGTLGSRLTVP
jgi:hypothetical protein